MEHRQLVISVFTANCIFGVTLLLGYLSYSMLAVFFWPLIMAACFSVALSLPHKVFVRRIEFYHANFEKENPHSVWSLWSFFSLSPSTTMFSKTSNKLFLLLFLAFVVYWFFFIPLMRVAIFVCLGIVLISILFRSRRVKRGLLTMYSANIKAIHLFLLNNCLSRAVSFLVRKWFALIHRNRHWLVSISLIIGCSAVLLLGTVFVVVELYQEISHLVEISSTALHSVDSETWRQYIPDFVSNANVTDYLLQSQKYLEANYPQIPKFVHSLAEIRLNATDEKSVDLLENLGKSWENLCAEPTLLFKWLSWSTIRDYAQHLWIVVKPIATILGGSTNIVATILTTAVSTLSSLVNTILSIGLFLLMAEKALSTNWARESILDQFAVMMNLAPEKLSQTFSRTFWAFFLMSLKLALFNAMFTWLVMRFFDVHFAYTMGLVSALASLLPIIPAILLPIPGVLELVAASNYLGACLLFVVHFVLPVVFGFTTLIYEDIEEECHPYLTGLAVVGGMTAFGMGGAVVGPVILVIAAIFLRVVRYSLALESPASPTSSEEDNRIMRRYFGTPKPSKTE